MYLISLTGGSDYAKSDSSESTESLDETAVRKKPKSASTNKSGHAQALSSSIKNREVISLDDDRDSSSSITPPPPPRRVKKQKEGT